MHWDIEVLILNFPLGEDRAWPCYVNHSPNLESDDCKVNRSIPVKAQLKGPHRITKSWQDSREELWAWRGFVYWFCCSQLHVFAGPHLGHANMCQSWVIQLTEESAPHAQTYSAFMNIYALLVYQGDLVHYSVDRVTRQAYIPNSYLRNVASWHLGCCVEDGSLQ